MPSVVLLLCGNFSILHSASFVNKYHNKFLFEGVKQMGIKIRLLQLGKKQVDLLAEIRKRGYKNLQPPALSAYINRKDTTAQAERVLELADEILKEWEAEQ